MVFLVALWDLQREGGSRDFPKAQLQFSPDAWQRMRWCAQGQKYKSLCQHQLGYGDHNQGRGGAEKLWADEKHFHATSYSN